MGGTLFNADVYAVKTIIISPIPKQTSPGSRMIKLCFCINAPTQKKVKIINRCPKMTGFFGPMVFTSFPPIGEKNIIGKILTRVIIPEIRGGKFKIFW